MLVAHNSIVALSFVIQLLFVVPKLTVCLRLTLKISSILNLLISSNCLPFLQTVLYILLQDLSLQYILSSTLKYLHNRFNFLTSAVLLQATTEIEIAIINNTFHFGLFVIYVCTAKNIKNKIVSS
jgi:hypothetical protein